MKYSWLGEQKQPTNYTRTSLKWKQKMGSLSLSKSILLEWKLKNSKPHNDHRVFKF